MANRNGSTQETKKATAVARSTGYTVQLPYSVAQIVEEDVYDHASMRANQLAALMQLISGDGVEVFGNLGHTTKDSLLWLAQQLAMEVADMMPIVAGQVEPTALKSGVQQ